MFWLKIKRYSIKLCNKTCGTTRFRIKVFGSNLHIDAEFSLRYTGWFDRKISRPVIQIFATSCIFQPKTNLSLSSFNDTCCSKIPQVYVRFSFNLDKIPSYPNICVKLLCSLIVKMEISNFFSETNLFYFKMWSSVKQPHHHHHHLHHILKMNVRC